jgi:nitronate monooxygenase
LCLILKFQSLITSKTYEIMAERNFEIIQGGMGAGVSNWNLARTVSRLGQLGVVSGTALDAILVRRLQDGDLEGQVRHALTNFPFQNM